MKSERMDDNIPALDIRNMVITGTNAEICFELERLFLHLALINDDSKLEAFTRKHLLDIIQCTSAGEVEVRNKGMEILTHLNRRIKSNPMITLPLDDILHYLLSSEENILGTNFAIVYLKIALDRVDIKEHITLLPNLLDILLKYINERKIFDQLIVLTKRAWISIANVNQQAWPSLESLQNKPVRSEILKFFSDVLYFPNWSEKRNMTTFLDNFCDHPCISKNGFLRIAKDVLSESKVSITALKLAVIKIVSSKIFTEAEILPLLIGATALGPSDVEVAGDVAIKKIDLEKVLRNKDTVNSLFNLYLGLSSQKMDKRDRVLPATIPIKLKLMPLLMRSPVAVQTFPYNIKIAFDGLFSKEDFVENKPLKLQQASIEFLLLIVKNFPANALPTFGPVIFSSIRKLIDQSESASVVATAYQCFGIIGSKVPQLVVNDMALLQETFDAIPSAPEEVSFAIADCLMSWLPAFCAINDVALSGVLEALISSYIIHESPKCRLAALKFVETLVKTPSLEFRWMLCRTCGDPRDEMKREALRLLDLSVANPTTIPRFEDLIEFVHRKLNLQDAAGDMDFSTAEAKKKKETFADEVFHVSALYLYANLQVACSLQPISLTEADIFSRTSDYPVINNYLFSITEEHPENLHFLLEIVLKAVEAQPANFLIEIACLFLYSGIGNLDHNYQTTIVLSLERHLNLNSQITVCAKLSQLYSLILSDIEKKKCLERCLEQLDSHDELLVKVPWLCSYLATQPFVDITAGEINRIKVCLVNVIETLSAQQYFEAACGSLAELLRRAIFSLSKVEKTNFVSSISDNQFYSLCELLGKIAASRKDTLTSKVKESAVQCLGFLSLHSLPTILYEKILAHLFACGEIATQLELQFTVGNALFDAAFGESSPSRRNIFTETEEHFLEKNLSAAEWDIIEKKVANLLKVLNAKLRHANRHLRQASLIWLFTLVKRCAVMRLTCIMSNLSCIQHAFINGLTETNEFSQEVASEGIGVIFELGSEEQKKVMVEELINTLSAGQKRVDPVGPDTVLFAKGELGTSPTGENLTTYKELCSLATDLNQPDLIYKFMQLANYNILWNSKKISFLFKFTFGAAFGFSIIMQKAKSAIEPYLAQLVPKLYRYRYDPDLKVQSAMRSIWQAITASKKSVVEEYANAIFNELKLTLTDPQWRTRESSCLALADLLSAHCTNEMVEHFDQLFEILYRVQDDIKESVRMAARRALSNLIKATLCRCSLVNGCKATRLLGIILPVIVEKGVRSSVKSNKMLSLKMIMDIAKEAGSTLQEHVNIIVPCLLDSLSEEESTVLNYLAARSSLDELEMLDSARMSAAHSSPMMSALRYVVPYIDKDVFNSLGDKLVDQLRSSVGVTTRTGSCQFIIDLCFQRQDLMMACQSSCDKIVRVLLNGLNDRNPVIKKQFSSCLSYLLPFSSKKEVNRIMDYIKQKLRSEQDEEKVTVLHLLRFLSRNSEILSNSLIDIVPFIFLYKCQEVAKDDEAGKKMLEMWDELWSELVPDTSSAIRLYREEMIEMALVTLNTSSVFALKTQAAKVLAAIAESGVLKDDVNCAEMLYDNLTSVLHGRIWDGKEKVIEAISALLRSAGKILASKWDETTVKTKFLPLWEQCSKKNEKYSGEAILCAAVFCEMTGCNNIAQQLMACVCNIISFNNSEPSSDNITSDVSDTNNLKAHDYLVKIVPTIAHLLLSFHGVELSNHVEQAVSLLKSDIFWKVKRALIIELPYFIERCSSHIDFTALFLAVGLLLIENDIAQRRTFARQCCIVLEYVVRQAQSRRCILSLRKHKDFVETLMKTSIVNSSSLLDDLPKYE
ncbi:Proteasome stabiliser family protein [Acanthocheilonema viteae]